MSDFDTQHDSLIQFEDDGGKESTMNALLEYTAPQGLRGATLFEAKHAGLWPYPESLNSAFRDLELAGKVHVRTDAEAACVGEDGAKRRNPRTGRLCNVYVAGSGYRRPRRKMTVREMDFDG